MVFHRCWRCGPAVIEEPCQAHQGAL
jgi:hypothetical protein